MYEEKTLENGYLDDEIMVAVKNIRNEFKEEYNLLLQMNRFGDKLSKKFSNPNGTAKDLLLFESLFK